MSLSRSFIQLPVHHRPVAVDEVDVLGRHSAEEEEPDRLLHHHRHLPPPERPTKIKKKETPSGTAKSKSRRKVRAKKSEAGARPPAPASTPSTQPFNAGVGCEGFFSRELYRQLNTHRPGRACLPRLQMHPFFGPCAHVSMCLLYRGFHTNRTGPLPLC